MYSLKGSQAKLKTFFKDVISDTSQVEDEDLHWQILTGLFSFRNFVSPIRQRINKLKKKTTRKTNHPFPYSNTGGHRARRPEGGAVHYTKPSSQDGVRSCPARAAAPCTQACSSRLPSPFQVLATEVGRTLSCPSVSGLKISM